MTYWGEFKDKNDLRNLDFIDKIINSSSLNDEHILQPPALKKFKNVEPILVNADHFQIDPVCLNNVEQLRYSITATNYLSDPDRKKGHHIEKPPKLNVNFKKSFLSSVDRISHLLDGDFSRGRFPSNNANNSNDNNNNNTSDNINNNKNNNNSNNNSNTNNSSNNNNNTILDVTSIHPSCIRKLIRKSIAIICINAGFTDCDESCLDTLVGVFHLFMTSLCSKISTYSSPSNPLQMPEFVAKVFLESGLGHPDDLIGWYGGHVVSLNKRLANQNDALYERCLKKQQDMEALSLM